MSKSLNKGLILLVVLCVAILNSGLFSYSYNVALAASTEDFSENFALPIRESHDKNKTISEPTEETNINVQTPGETNFPVVSHGQSSNDKVTICHFPSGNITNGHVIEVNSSALAAHLEHGDIMGACPKPADDCAALMQNIKNFQGVQMNIKNGTYDANFDLDGDGAIDLSDVVIATAAQPAADTNADGVVNLTDVVNAAKCQNSDPVYQYCQGLLQNIKNFQGVQMNIKNGTYDANFDLDGDGAIDLSDVVIATAAQPAADVNGDGVVNLTDVVLASQCHFEQPQVEQQQVIYELASDPSVPTSTAATQEYCHSLINSMGLVQSVDHSATGYPSDDLNGDGVINLSDTVLINQLDRGGKNGGPDGVINLTDVVLLAQFCADFIPSEPSQPALISSPRLPEQPFIGANLFTDLTSGSELVPQVLGENIEDCSADLDIVGKTEFANGSLIRACDDQRVYLIKDGQKLHINTLDLLRAKYQGKRIYNVSPDVVDSYANWTPKVLGIKEDGNNKLVKSSSKK